MPPTRRVPPEALSPRAKTHNYLNLITADLEAKAQDKEAWSVLLDAAGPSCRGHRQQHFYRPRRRGVDAVRALGIAWGQPRRR